MRIASYSQQSQRYAKVQTNEDWFVTPKTVKDNKEADFYYQSLMQQIALTYNEMCALGIPPEDARMILPNACKTSIIVSMNARSFSEACKKRCCFKAQWEIRQLFFEMREIIKNIYPHIYPLCFPNCYTIGCQEKTSCSTKPTAKNVDSTDMPPTQE